MLKLIKKISTVTLVLGTVTAFAQDISLSEPIYGGNGCPSGTASATVTPDGKALSIIFDQFISEAGPASGKTIDRKSCNIGVSVHVPGGFSMSVIAVDYRGFVSLPSSSTSARFQAEYFFAGMRGPQFVKDFRGRMDQDYMFSNQLGVQAAVWSPCGADVNLRVNASMLVKNSTHQDALATVDSADINAGLIYHIRTRSCR
ncbi:MAG TPA: DUF4360 domain-containing protein [Bacteriovoracaceae bacterium]|nr:DUF4360 domain-containing protein [Bacteriovoracaceae bacterium]